MRSCFPGISAVILGVTDPNRFGVIPVNTCGEDVQLYYCLERTSGAWSCGCTTLAPGDSTVGAWVCSGTGNFRIHGTTSDESSVYACFENFPPE